MQATSFLTEARVIGCEHALLLICLCLCKRLCCLMLCSVVLNFCLKIVSAWCFSVLFHMMIPVRPILQLHFFYFTMAFEL